MALKALAPLLLLTLGLLLSIAGATWLLGPVSLMVGGALICVIGVLLIEVDKPFRR